LKTVNFFFATHNHQPIGNFGFVLKAAFKHSYKPFFDVAAKHPKVKFGTHFSGALLDWLVANEPKHLAKLRTLAESGQLEFLTGGYFEPIISVIPPWDQQSQISRLTNAVREHFGTEPAGMWLAERVWEQGLASILPRAGVKYVVLDDTHFLAAGLSPNVLNGYYLTEDQGRTLALFPISKELRYTMPFQPVDETIRVLRDQASDSGENLVFFADDGEKFGVWPGTYKTVYGQGWLEELFAKIEENSSWIKTQHGSEILRDFKPLGHIYIPNCSYSEMLEWSLPNAPAGIAYDDLANRLKHEGLWSDAQRFVRGGFWRNFFVKYPESNYLHQRAWKASERLHALKQRTTVASSLETAEHHVLAAEANDVYWHGVFGGIYLNNLRDAAWTDLLKGEAAMDAVQPEPMSSLSDVDADEREEIILHAGHTKLVIAPHRGAAIIEHDYMPKGFNALNILNRRPEAYHAKLREAVPADEVKKAKSIHEVILTKERGLEKHLIYDHYLHASGLDHFFDPKIKISALGKGDYRELSDLHTAGWAFAPLTDAASVDLHRTAQVEQQSGSLLIEVSKRIELEGKKGDAKVTHRIANVSGDVLHCTFAVEWCANFLAPKTHDRYFEADGKRLEKPFLVSTGIVTGASRFRIVDEYLGLALSFEAEGAEYWRLPIETISMSESGFERVYQGSMIFMVWKLALKPQEVWKREVTVKFESP